MAISHAGEDKKNSGVQNKTTAASRGWVKTRLIPSDQVKHRSGHLFDPNHWLIRRHNQTSEGVCDTVLFPASMRETELCDYPKGISFNLDSPKT
ncbi:hypothetical protein HRI_004231800 [Hibiscus trionum]|uniref:Uncharacterized protein n=1 Tax=Hibiscus trionum TaxID=183268 RepID=A0A9W7J0S3_HIBTR|nr:hypothetical protein HRI_004231800 [Hibiscus trionum]